MHQKIKWNFYTSCGPYLRKWSMWKTTIIHGWSINTVNYVRLLGKIFATLQPLHLSTSVLSTARLSTANSIIWNWCNILRSVNTRQVKICFKSRHTHVWYLQLDEYMCSYFVTFVSHLPVNLDVFRNVTLCAMRIEPEIPCLSQHWFLDYIDFNYLQNFIVPNVYIYIYILT
jgi:hypothetical protein